MLATMSQVLKVLVYLEKCVGLFLFSGECSSSVLSSAKTDCGAAGEIGMGGSSHFLAATTQSSLAPLQSCLVDDSIVLLNMVFLLQDSRVLLRCKLSCKIYSTKYSAVSLSPTWLNVGRYTG